MKNEKKQASDFNIGTPNNDQIDVAFILKSTWLPYRHSVVFLYKELLEVEELKTCIEFVKLHSQNS